MLASVVVDDGDVEVFARTCRVATSGPKTRAASGHTALGGCADYTVGLGAMRAKQTGAHPWIWFARCMLLYYQ